MTRRGTGSRQGLRPLQGRRRRRHPLAHAARHAPEQGRLLHARHHARPLRALLRGRARLPLQRGAPAEEVRHRGHAGAAAGGACGGARRTRLGVIYFGSTAPAMDEALEVLAERGIHLDAMRLRAFPFPPSVAEFIAGARPGLRRRAEPRRADAHAAGQRARHRPGRADAGAALRRHADHGALHRPGDHAPGARAGRGARAKEQVHDLHRQTPAAPPDADDATRSATRGATTKARSPRCAPAAATTRSRPPSSRPAGSSTSSRTAWPSSRASAAAARRPTTSWAPATASTPCTAACPAC